MLDVFAKSGLAVRAELDGSSYHLTILFGDPAGKGTRPDPAHATARDPAIP